MVIASPSSCIYNTQTKTTVASLAPLGTGDEIFKHHRKGLSVRPFLGQRLVNQLLQLSGEARLLLVHVRPAVHTFVVAQLMHGLPVAFLYLAREGIRSRKVCFVKYLL